MSVGLAVDSISSYVSQRGGRPPCGPDAHASRTRWRHAGSP